MIEHGTKIQLASGVGHNLVWLSSPRDRFKLIHWGIFELKSGDIAGKTHTSSSDREF